RTPVRATITGTAWSRSVSSSTTAVPGAVWITCPTTPPASITVCPWLTPSRLPARSTSRCRVGSRSMSRIGASCTSSPPLPAAPSSWRRWVFSSAAACSRARRALATSSSLRRRWLSSLSSDRVTASSRTLRASREGSPASHHTGCIATPAWARTWSSQPPRWSATIRPIETASRASRRSVPVASPERWVAGLAKEGTNNARASGGWLERQGRPRRRPLRGNCQLSHGPWPPVAGAGSVGGEELVAVHVQQLQRASAAAGHAGQRVFGDLHVQAGFLAEQLVQVLQQGAAAGEHDAALGHVRAELRRGLLQRLAHRLDDAGQRFAQRVEHLAGLD